MSLEETSEFVDQSVGAVDDKALVDGYEKPDDDGMGEFPLDSVLVRTETRTVNEVVQRIQNDRFILDPDFQREFVWEKKKQSKFIESCLMRIPLPVIYLAQTKDGRVIVVDGLQRLTTFCNFIEGGFKLTGLQNDRELEGKKMNQLPIHLQERVLDTQLTLNILDSRAPDRAKMEIFERVNSGAPLSRQQMRNALYNGLATAWLKDVSEGKNFKLATNESFSRGTMRDREAINRFVSFYLLGVEKYPPGDMDKFLAMGIQELDTLDDDKRTELKELFELTMKLNYELFGEHAFRKSLYNKEGRKSVINISLFDVLSVSFTKLIAKLDAKNMSDLKREIEVKNLKKIVIEALDGQEFWDAITIATNSEYAVKFRYKTISDMIEDQLGVKL